MTLPIDPNSIDWAAMSDGIADGSIGVPEFTRATTKLRDIWAEYHIRDDASVCVHFWPEGFGPDDNGGSFPADMENRLRIFLTYDGVETGYEPAVNSWFLDMQMATPPTPELVEMLLSSME